MPEVREDDQGAPRRSGSGWVPVPDPTTLTTEAVERATAVFRRDIDALRVMHDKDLAQFRELASARTDAMDQDRARLWERAHEMTAEFDATLTRFRAEVERRDQAGRELVEQRLTDLDKARHLVAAQFTDIPAKITSQIAREREFLMAQMEIISTRMTEKFSAVDEQFSASKIAVDAALTAQKEAVSEQNKANSAAIRVSEGNTKEQLTSLGQVADASFKAVEDKVEDARNRITVIESLTRGIREAGADSHYGQTFDQTARIAVAGQQRVTLSIVIAGISVLVAMIAVITLILKKLREDARWPRDSTTPSIPIRL